MNMTIFNEVLEIRTVNSILHMI